MFTPLTRTLTRPILNSSSILIRQMTVIGPTSALEYKKLNYNARMEKTNRPVSPHVMIYAFPLVALSSITVRVTGVLLTAGVSGVAITSLAGYDPTHIANLIGDSSFALPAKLIVALPLSYHFIGGVRHAYWDYNPEVVTNELVEKSSWGVIGGSLIVTLGALCL